MLLRIRSRRQTLVLPILLALPGPGLVGGMMMQSLGLITGGRFKMLFIPGGRLLV